MSARIDLVGKEFGRLTVIEFAGSEDGIARWKCLCSCGKFHIVDGGELRRGNVNSCGCLRKELAREMCKTIKHKECINLVGRVFGRLTVISRVSGTVCPIKWLCSCVCGSQHTASGDCLRSGGSTSCGCYQKEHARELNTTHGMSHTPTYRTWQSMCQRCFDSNKDNHAHYGGRGITVCDRWLAFENFYADMGDRPKGTSIDRIDNNGNYSPENCRWATNEVQSANKRTSIMHTCSGVTGTLRQLCNNLTPTVSYRLAKSRLRNGWSIEDALFTPVGEKRKKST